MKYLLPLGLCFILAIVLFTLGSRLPKNLQTDSTAKSSVPEANDKNQEKGVAVPYGTYQTVPGNTSKIRVFALSASKNSFSFEKLIVFQNDIVRIHFTPKDKTYDISIPALSIKVTAKLGEVTPIEFQVGAPGTFRISCDSCSDPKPQASLVVVTR